MSAKIATYREGRFSHFERRDEAAKKVACGQYRWLGEDRREMEEVPLDLTVRDIPATFDGPLGVGNLLPFAKIQNKLRAPAKLHYSIPACGAHNPPPVSVAQTYGY